jgi:hypothetical protein
MMVRVAIWFGGVMIDFFCHGKADFTIKQDEISSELKTVPVKEKIDFGGNGNGGIQVEKKEDIGAPVVKKRDGSGPVPDGVNQKIIEWNEYQEGISGKKITRAALAAIIGINSTALSSYITGEKKPGHETFQKIVKAFGVSTDEFLAGPPVKKN